MPLHQSRDLHDEERVPVGGLEHALRRRVVTPGEQSANVGFVQTRERRPMRDPRNLRQQRTDDRALGILIAIRREHQQRRAVDLSRDEVEELNGGSIGGVKVVE